MLCLGCSFDLILMRYFIDCFASAFVLTNQMERYASESNNTDINNNIVKHNNVNQATSGTV